jgi:hypothetical protein
MVEEFLRDHPPGSRVRADEVPVKVFIEVMRQGYLAQLPGTEHGYQLVTYMVIQPNGQTDH